MAHPRFFRTLRMAGLLAALAVLDAHAGEVEDLDEVRDLAAALLKGDPDRKTAAYCEFTISRPGNPCAGARALEDSLRVGGDGTLRYRRFRSFAESHQHNPGEFTGQVGPEGWRDLLGKLSGLRWLKSPASMPMPGHFDSHQLLVLGDGRTTASYSIAGRIPFGQDSLENAFSHLESLSPLAADTLWSVALAAEGARFRKGILEVDAVWKVSGKAPVGLRLPARGKPEDCGAISLTWFTDEPEAPGVTPLPVEPRHRGPSDGFKGEGAWRTVAPGGTAKARLRFKLPKQAGASRTGKLVHLGAQVRASEAGPPATVTVFSPQFSF